MIRGPRHMIFVTLYLLYSVSHNLVTLHDGVNVVRRKMRVTQSKEVWTICLPSIYARLNNMLFRRPYRHAKVRQERNHFVINQLRG